MIVFSIVLALAIVSIDVKTDASTFSITLSRDRLARRLHLLLPPGSRLRGDHGGDASS
jgi:hypothetical protein